MNSVEYNLRYAHYLIGRYGGELGDTWFVFYQCFKRPNAPYSEDSGKWTTYYDRAYTNYQHAKWKREKRVPKTLSPEKMRNYVYDKPPLLYDGPHPEIAENLASGGGIYRTSYRKLADIAQFLDRTRSPVPSVARGRKKLRPDQGAVGAVVLRQA